MPTITVPAVVRELRRRYPNRNWLGQCQRLVWNVVWIALGGDAAAERRMGSYPTALAAQRASSIYTNDIGKAQVGDSVFFDVADPAEHVAIVVGHNLMLQASTQSDTVTNYGQGMKVSHISRYPGRRIGFSRRNGTSPEVDVILSGTAGTPGKEIDDMPSAEEVAHAVWTLEMHHAGQTETSASAATHLRYGRRSAQDALVAARGALKVAEEVRELVKAQESGGAPTDEQVTNAIRTVLSDDAILDRLAAKIGADYAARLAEK